MQNNKMKNKIKNFNFYIISDDYINYLHQFEKHIAFNKNEARPYIGIVLQINNCYYFAPLYSPKMQHQKYKDNLTFFRIIDPKTKNNLGIIRFSDMIPVPKNDLYLLDISSKSYGYKRLLNTQYSIINTPINKNSIVDKARSIYNIVNNKNLQNKTALFYKSLSCNFALLEEKCKEREINEIKNQAQNDFKVLNCTIKEKDNEDGVKIIKKQIHNIFKNISNEEELNIYIEIFSENMDNDILRRTYNCNDTFNKNKKSVEDILQLYAKSTIFIDTIMFGNFKNFLNDNLKNNENMNIEERFMNVIRNIENENMYYILPKTETNSEENEVFEIHLKDLEQNKNANEEANEDEI